MDNTSVSMVFRIEKDLKQAFEQVAQSQDMTVSQMLRKYIRWEVEKHTKENAQKDLFKPSEAPRTQNPTKKPQKDKKQIPQGKNALLAMFKGK